MEPTRFAILLVFAAVIVQVGWADVCRQQTTCQACTNSTDGFAQGCTWCPSHGPSGGCFQFLHAPLFCSHVSQIISIGYNCPVDPPSGALAYNDVDGRRGLFWATAAYAENPHNCFTRQMPDMVLHASYESECNASSSIFGPDGCIAFSAVSTARRVVVLAFRGTLGVQQILHELGSALEKSTVPSGGKVMTYFDLGFESLFHAGGIRQDLVALKTAFPSYKLIVTGHSLGGAMAAFAATTIAYQNLWPRNNIRLITYGEPRVGDMSFAQSLNTLLPYSYRVIHKHDIVPHTPPLIPGSAGQLVDSYYHHRFEVWYNNDMTSGSTHNICHSAEDNDGTCSDDHIDASIEDHLHYYGVKIPDYGIQGCTSAFPFS